MNLLSKAVSCSKRQSKLSLIAMPRQKATYESSLLQNVSQISSIESSLRSLTWIMPGRFQDSELASEGRKFLTAGEAILAELRATVLAVLHLINLYHDSIVKKAADRLPDHKKPKLSAHAKYTTYCLQHSRTYALCARMVTIIGYTELVVEMIARKKLTRNKKWRLIITLEAAKATLRLFLLQATSYRPIVTPPMPQREVSPAEIETKTGPRANGPHPDLAWKGSRTEQIHPTLHSLRPEAANGHLTNGDMYEDSYLDDFLRKSRFLPRDVKSPAQLILPLQGLMERWNEVIWILRPLIYVIALRKYGTRSYGPFLLSILLETLSARAGRGRFLTESELEKAERARRQMQLWRYMFRGPAWAAFTKPRLRSFATQLESKPLIGFAGAMLREYIGLFDSYYYYVGS